METRPVVIQTEDLAPDAAAWLGERCELIACPCPNQAFEAHLSRAHGLVVRTYTRVGKDLLARAPNLRVVARAGVGLEHIDVPACRQRGVEVVHTPDANSSAVAEYAFALLFDALRPRLFLDATITNERWAQARAELKAPRQLEGLAMGVWGMGRIGTRVARIGAALNMKVLYHDLLDIPEDRRHGASPVTRDELLDQSDVLTLHVDPRPANHRMISGDVLARLRRDVVFINTARGVLVDAPALADFLRANTRALALIDVHDPEPFDASYPLLGLTNAHLSPHLAAATLQAHDAMSWVVRDLWRVLEGQAPEHPAP